MSKTKIQWTDETWNPVTGCSRVSEGCRNCYAERLAPRLKAMGVQKYANGFDVTLHHAALSLPSSWKKPRMVFVNSMGDLFHDDVPDDFIRKVFEVMEKEPRHTFQVLTKRHERLLGLADALPWPDNVWMGVSVESPAHLDRVEALRRVLAALRFISFEPLISAIGSDVDLTGIGWVIVGGETGPGGRPLHPQWVRDIRDACLMEWVPFFFKQWGGGRASGAELDGFIWHHMPTIKKPEEVNGD